MKQSTLTIQNPYGLHARPATELVNLASTFDSEITILTNGRKANAKSIINVMSLAIGHGEKIHLVVNGQDEKEAIQAIEQLLINLKD